MTLGFGFQVSLARKFVYHEAFHFNYTIFILETSLRIVVVKVFSAACRARLMILFDF